MIFPQVHSAIFWLLLLIATPAAALVPAPEALREQGIRLEKGETGIPDARSAYKLFCLAALEGDSRALRSHLLKVRCFMNAPPKSLLSPSYCW